MDFSTTAINVLVLVALAIPGFLLVKSKLIKAKAIPYFSAVLLYVCQPFLSLQSFLKVEYSTTILAGMGWTFLFAVVTQLALFLILWAVFKRKFDNPEITVHLQAEGYLGGDKITQDPMLKAQIARTAEGRAYRAVVNLATFGNVGFFGVPLLTLLFPLNPEAVVYSAVYVCAMNMMGWSIGVYILTGNKKFMSVKKALVNPPTLTLLVALPLFFAGVTLAKMPMEIGKIIGYFGDMTAPMCMIILGMRFGSQPLKSLFTDWKNYLASFVKLLVFPVVVFLIVWGLPLDRMLKVTLVIMSAMPSATNTLNFAELYGADKKTSANTILLSTIFSILTIPLVMLLLGVLK